MSGQEEVQLPPGWKASYDKRTERAFYVNLVTKERTWHRPLLDSEPRDFYRKFDRKSGRIFYVNFATKKTCWKLPPRAVVKEIKELKEQQKRNSPPKPRRQPRAHPSPQRPSRQQQRPQQAAQQSPATEQPRSPVQQAFDQADRNGDGVLDQEEFAQLVERARQQAAQSQYPPSPAKRDSGSNSSPSVSAAAQQRLPAGASPSRSRYGAANNDNNGYSPAKVHVTRNGSIFISPAGGRKQASPAQRQSQPAQLDEFPDTPQDEDPATPQAGNSVPEEVLNVHTTSDYVRRLVEQRQAADDEVSNSRPLYPVDSENNAENEDGEGEHGEVGEDSGPADFPRQPDEEESKAYHGGTHAKSGTSTLSAHVPDKSLATLHHDTESLVQDNKILRAQCGDIRADLDRFKSGLSDSLSEVADLLQTLAGIETRHQQTAATSPRRLRYGRNAGDTPMLIENGSASDESLNAQNIGSIHIGSDGKVTITPRK